MLITQWYTSACIFDVDICVGFRGEIMRNDYWSIENEAVDFEHLDLATYYTSIGRKDRYAWHKYSNSLASSQIKWTDRRV